MGEAADAVHAFNIPGSRCVFLSGNTARDRSDMIMRPLHLERNFMRAIASIMQMEKKAACWEGLIDKEIIDKSI